MKELIRKSSPPRAAVVAATLAQASVVLAHSQVLRDTSQVLRDTAVELQRDACALRMRARKAPPAAES